jgi:hypothetical protein
MLYRLFVLAASLALVGLGSLGCRPAVSASGLVAADGRAFAYDAKYPGQDRGDAVSLVAEPQLDVKSGDGVHAATVRPFYRLDPKDDKRSHADVRDASYRLAAGRFHAGVGAGIFTWGVLESYKPTDVMNQTDFVEAADGSAKLGQPYASVGWVGDAAALRVYYLPYFRDRTFQGLRGRPRLSVPVDTDSPIIDARLRRWQPSGAARFTLNLGDFDLGAGVFSGLSREPRFIAELTTGSVSPRYDVMHQASVDAQWTIGALVLKAEGFGRLWGDSLRAFGGGGAGADYTFFKLLGEADLSFAAEVLFDTRPLAAAPTFFQHDGFAGVRLAVNDASSTEALVGGIVDLVDQSTFARGGLSRRFGDHWRASVDVNVYLGPRGKLESSFLKDDNLHGRIAYFF